VDTITIQKRIARSFNLGEQSGSPRRRAVLLIARAIPALLIPVGFVYIALHHLRFVVTVRNVDYFQFVELAQRLNINSLGSWVNGMHPNGYPLLVRGGLTIGLDAVRIGHLLSISGGVLLLASVYLLAYRMTNSRWLALLSEAFLATTGYFLYFATWEGNDMLSAGLQGLSLASLSDLLERKKTYFIAGLLAGLAYLIRYTAIVTMALCLLFLVLQALAKRQRSAWVKPTLFLIGFTVGATLQLLPSTLVTGNPFYSVRGRDVWWHVEGRFDFATEWNLAPEDLSLVRVFLSNPDRFMRHWWNTARSFWLDPGLLLLDVPLRLLTQAALLFTLLNGKGISTKKRALLAVYVLGLLAALAVIRYDPRFLIVILPVLVFCAVYFVWTIAPRQLSVGSFKLPIGALTLIALLFVARSVPEHFRQHPAQSNADILAVSRTLRAGGMQSADQVLSSAIPFHDVSVPARSRYAQSYWMAPSLNSLPELHTLAREKDYRFIVYDTDTGLNAHPGLEELLNPGSHLFALTPLLVPESRNFIVYRIETEKVQPTHDLDVHLGKGIVLLGYDLYIVRDAPEIVVPRVGVFLYWRATQAISQSYKVFVHVLNADGQLVAQDDSVPALWTFPTDAWRVGETVIDFHSIALPAETMPGVYTLQVGMYNGQTLQRLPVLSAIGEPIDDKVTLLPVLVETGK